MYVRVCEYYEATECNMFVITIIYHSAISTFLNYPFIISSLFFNQPYNIIQDYYSA